MKSLRLLAVVAVASAALFVRPAAAQKQKPAPTPDEQRRREVVRDYFAESRAHARAQAEARPQTQDRRDPKWMDAMQQLLKDLADENAKLRTENESLRADSEALRRQLDAYERAARRQRDNRGTFVIPPEALRNMQPGKNVPDSWKPFEFNGATYYIVPLKAGEGAVGATTDLLIQAPAGGRAVEAKPAPPARPTK